MDNNSFRPKLTPNHQRMPLTTGFKIRITRLLLSFAAMLLQTASHCQSLQTRWHCNILVAVGSGYYLTTNYYGNTTGLFQCTYQDSVTDAAGFAFQNSVITVSGNALTVVASGACSDSFTGTNGIDGSQDLYTGSDVSATFTTDSLFYYSLAVSLGQTTTLPYTIYANDPPGSSACLYLGSPPLQPSNTNFVARFGTDAEGGSATNLWGPLSGTVSGTLAAGTYTLGVSSTFFRDDLLYSYFPSISDGGTWQVIFTLAPSNIISTTISGHISDACIGLPITNATVQIGPLSALSDVNGYYSQSGLPPCRCQSSIFALFTLPFNL